MNFNKQLSDEIFKMYLNEKIGFNDICKECKNAAKNANKELRFGPVPVFHIGKDYGENEKKLLIVGTVAYGWGELNGFWEKAFNDDIRAKEKIQSIVEQDFKHYFFNERKKAIFNYTRFALSLIFGSTQKAFDNIAMTNMVHCNPSKDSTNENLIQKTRNFCVNNEFNGFIHRELDILEPTHTVFLVKPSDSGKVKYLNYIKNTPWNYIAIEHPSSRRRTKEGFRLDIAEFLQS